MDERAKFERAEAAQPVAWIRQHPDGSLTREVLLDSVIEDARKASGAWVPLVVAEAAQRVPQGWISVEDRLPTTGDPVLVYRPSGKYDKVWIDCWREQPEAPVSFSSATISVGHGWDEHDFEDVTHWMPLPAPPATEPKGERDEP